MKANKRWKFKGDVYVDGFLIERNYQDETWAPTEKKARNNLTFRNKRDRNLPFPSKLKLDGVFEMVV